MERDTSVVSKSKLSNLIFYSGRHLRRPFRIRLPSSCRSPTRPLSRRLKKQSRRQYARSGWIGIRWRCRRPTYRRWSVACRRPTSVGTGSSRRSTWLAIRSTRRSTTTRGITSKSRSVSARNSQMRAIVLTQRNSMTMTASRMTTRMSRLWRFPPKTGPGPPKLILS